MLTDKNAILQVIGSLMKQPSLLSEKDKYSLQISDFNDKFERYIFIAIVNLYIGGAQEISEIDIDNYLKPHKDQYQIFEHQKGIEYLQDAIDMSSVESFGYYYNRLKKFNCLRDLKKAGYDISRFYEENELNPQQFEINQRFETLTPREIFDELKRSIFGIESEYSGSDASETKSAFSGMRELVEKLKISPDAGARFQGKFFNTITRGARKGKFYIVSMGSGVGKTRHLLGEACYLAYPIRYDLDNNEWKITGNSEKTLFIATEQTLEEIQTMILAYLTGINEDVLLYGNFNKEQSERIQQALFLMEQYKDNLQVVRVAMPSVGIMKNLVRQNCLIHNIKNVFFDYIFSNPGLLNEFRDLKVREDVALLMLSTALKDLAVEQNIFMMSATQITTSDNDSNEKGIKDQKNIRGAKSIIDKADIGMIGGLVSDGDVEKLIVPIQKHGGLVPTQVQDVYKVRRGRWTNVRVWSDVDLGTCRRRDLFMTNANFNEIVIDTVEVNFDDNYNKYDEIVKQLNNMGSELKTITHIEVDETGEISVSDAPVEKGLFGGLI